MLVPLAASAQVISGVVREPTGALAAGAVVVLVDTSGNRIASSVAALDGRYKIDVGGAGTFWLRVTASRFPGSFSPAFTVEPGEEVSYDHTVPTEAALNALERRARQCPTAAPRGTFVGTPVSRIRVVDEATGSLVPNAIVSLLDSTGRVRATGTTDAAGVAPLGYRADLSDLLCIRKLGMPITFRLGNEAPDDPAVPWMVFVRAPARELSAVEVRATRRERMRELGVPQTARFYALDDFAAYVPSALNFGDLLRPMNASGVTLKSANGRVNCVMLRGTVCIPTMVDNVPSNTVYDLDPFLIEAIAILTPSDAQQRFGSLGINGLLLIYTKRNVGGRPIKPN